MIYLYLYINSNLFSSQAEAEFEWGNPFNQFVGTLANGVEKKLAEASFRWRKIIEKNPKRGIFEGIRIILHTSPTRAEAFRRLIELGKGSVVVGVAPPYKETFGATHCLAELSKMPRAKIDFDSMAAKGIAVVNPVYINEFMISDPPPKVEPHLIDEYRPFWERRKRNKE